MQIYDFSENRCSRRRIKQTTVNKKAGVIVKGGTLENFYLKRKEGSHFFWDLTDKYKEAYPQVTKVELVWAAAQHF